MRPYLLIGVCFFLGTAVVCHATQPECTGDRHYDGVACCPATVTTTTVPPGDDDECPACPDVTCGSGDTTYNVTVNRCPNIPPAPKYIPCRKTKKGIKCPAPAHTHRVLVPVKS